MSGLIIILVVIVGFLYIYISGGIGGVPKLIKTLADKDFKAEDFDCDKEKAHIRKLLEHEEGDGPEIDFLFEQVYTKHTLNEIQAILLKACPDALKQTSSYIGGEFGRGGDDGGEFGRGEFGRGEFGRDGDVFHCIEKYGTTWSTCINGSQERSYSIIPPGPGGNACPTTPILPISRPCWG